MKILLTGGCGYTGTVLTNRLLDDGHVVDVLDAQWFGNHLSDHENLTVLNQDVRDTDKISLEGVDVVLHLANVANDPSVDLEPTLSWEINVLSTMRLADKAVRSGVKQFIFASSGSVYGVKDEDQVTEDLELIPISVYNKTKMVAERVLLSYSDKMQVHSIRPATVCGTSPRMRLDVAVNLLTMAALDKGEITVLGGDQTRPNIHIDDLIDVYTHFIANPDIASGNYNAGFENISILDIAELVKTKVEANVVIKPSNDPRSYRLNSDKLLATGFSPKRSVGLAIDEIAAGYRAGVIKDDVSCYNVRKMKELILQNLI
ncbi:SDR family oxidoreductase [Verrucomicrobia bacterium]|nr:SDR family oxidoreductase [Verrucomicrobiota bacterium]